jgi:hypothetical protein
LDVRWSNTADDAVLEVFSLMRVSVSNDAIGTWDVLVTPDGETPRNLDLAIFNGSVRLRGDLNGDGFVGQDDMGFILGPWGQSVTPGSSEENATGDGFVGQDDLNHVLANWGKGAPPIIATSNAVPEPQSLVLAIAALVSMLPLFSHRGRMPV